MSMIRSSIGRRTTDGTTAAATLEFIAGAKGCFVRQIVISLAAATASTFGIGRPAALGITPTSPVTSLAEPGDGIVTVKSAVAWATGPTVPAAFFRRVGFPATIGSFQPFNFDGGSGLWIPPNQSIVVWNLAANGVCDVTIVADEPAVAPTF